ncbi:uncharacterized protein [Aquarana catesbeiana]|uniref:uncharacterized protein isoform X2 n=1 Tax=Aquarana catesbeiana TaxID=8400 RepID=UPI003CCA628E
MVAVNSRCPPHPSFLTSSHSNGCKNESENKRSLDFHTTPESQKMSAVKALFLILLWQMSLLHNEAALVVSAPSSHRAQLGENFVLPCSFKVDDQSINLQFLAILWLFQGNEVLRIDNKGTVSQPRMFINQQDITKGNANMEIRNVTISDIGKYRCMVIYSPQKEFKDIDLNVYATPSVTIEKVEKEDKTSFALCSVMGFYPREISVELLMDRTIMEDSVLSDHTNADGTYSVNRTWTIPTDVSPKILSCSVRHETLSPSVQKDLQLAYQGRNNDNESNVGAIVGCIIGVLILLALIGAVYYYKRNAGSQKFSMGDIESPVWIDGAKTTLSCKASNCTGDAQVTWVILSKDGSRLEVSENPSTDKEEEEPLMSREYEVTRNIVNKKKGKLKDVTTKLTFIPSISRHLGTTVTCKVLDNKETMEKTYDPKSILAKPKFNEPVKSTLSPQGEVELSATLQSFYPEKMEISWTSKSAKSQEKIQSKENMSNNGNKFNLESKCTVPGELFKDPKFKVMVTWKHESMEGPEFRELSVRDLPWHPKLQATPIESVFQGDEVLLQCRVSDYFPDALVVKWFEKKTGRQQLVEITSSEKYNIPEISSYRTENGTFSSTADLSYKRSDLSEKGIEFICRVEHPSLGTPLQNTILQYKDAAEMPTFSINNIYGPQTWYNGEKVTLYCGASYCTENTKAIWRVTEADGTRYDILETPSGEETKSGLQHSGYVAHRERTEKSDKEDLLDFTSSLTFTPSITKHLNVTIACKIEDSGEKFKEKTFHCKNIFAKPTVSGPIKLSLTDSEEVLCSLDIEKFYPSNIQIKWNNKETSDCGKISQNGDRTYTINSEYKLPGSFFSLPDSVVKVSWKHDSMEDWESREMSVLDKEFPWKPEVCDIPVPNLFYGNTATLKCKVSNVFPKVLSVKWLKKEKDSEQKFPLSQNDGFNISELTPEKQKDNTFTYKACLKFKPSITDEGEEFFCRVKHPSLKEPVEKSTGPLTIKDIVISPSEKQDTPLHRAQDVSMTESAVILPPTDQVRFIVGKIQGPRRWIHGEKVALYISLSYCSEDTRVMWMVEKTDGKVEEISNNGGDPQTDSGYTISKESEESDKEGLFNITSSLTFVSSVSRHPQVTFACKITSDGQTKTMKFQPESIYAKPQALEPVKTKLCDKGDVLCSLNLQKFYPKDVELSWRSGEDKLESREKYEENNDGTFNGKSHCTVPGKLLLNPNFTLHVTWNHKSLDGQQSQVLSWRDPGLSWCPVIEEVPIPHVLTERWNTLQYNISRYFPDDVTVIWYRKEKGAQEYIPLSQDKKYQIPDIQSQRQSDLTYSCTARLLFTPIVADGESEIMCRVSHPSLERPIERESGPLQVQGKPKNRKSMKPSLGIGKVTFCHILENFYPKHIQIEWNYWSGEKLKQRCQSQEKYTPMLNKTFTVVSECGVSEDLLQSPDFRVRVSWRHESMDEEEYKEFSIKDKDFPWRPHLEMSVLPLRIREEATIQCAVTKYFPDAVNVTWFRKNEQSREMYPVTSDGMYRILNIPLERQNDQPYGCISSVTFSPSLERDQGVEYICRVEHPSLEQPIEKSTGALQVTEPEQQNQLPQYEDNQEAYQDHNSDTTMVKMGEDDCGMNSDPMETNRDTEDSPSLERDQGVEYICRVEHPSLEQPIEKSTGALQVTEPEQQNQLPQYEDNQEAYQDHNSDTTMVKTGDDDWEMNSDPEETNLDTPGATYVKKKQKPSSKLYGPHHAMYDEKDQEKKRKNPETKKHASDNTMIKLKHLSRNSYEMV